MLEGPQPGVLARRADISLRTIHNPFENKENMLGLSVLRYFAKFEESVATLLGAIAAVTTTHLRQSAGETLQRFGSTCTLLTEYERRTVSATGIGN